MRRIFRPSSSRSIPIILFAPGLAAVLAGVFAAQPSQAQTAPAVASIHGTVAADVPGPAGRVAIPISGAAIAVQDVTTGAARGEAVTTWTGAFSTPLQPPGTYRVCAKATGWVENCSGPVQVTTDTAVLPELLMLKSEGGVLHGHVSLQDGSQAARSGVVRGTTAGAARVSLTAGGRVLAGPANVNANGDYVLSPVAPGNDLTLTANYEGATASQPINPTQADLDRGTPVDIKLPSAPPAVASITMTQNGAPVTTVAPGATVTLSAQVQDAGPGPLHYRWTSNAPGLAAADAPSVTMTLPNAPVATVVFVEITNGQGGATRGSITLPLAGAPEQRTLQFHPIAPAIVGRPIPINPCIFFIYCIPTHQGPFIDPTILMNGACSDEASCETEATAYYKAIGALNANGTPAQTGTFKGWKSTYGFGADPLQPAANEVRAVYYNNGDLKFGRDMHCRSNSSFFSLTVACYVSNYGDGTHTFGSDPQTAISRAASNTGRIATVAMVYFFSNIIIVGGTPTPYRVQFYVFNNSLNNDPNDGSLLTNAILDSQGPKAVPGVCLTCHGGSYDGNAHKAQNSNFLPFDAPTFIFSNSSIFLLESAQREAIRQLNGMVKSATYARPTISQLIDGWYQWCGGVGTNNCYIDDVGHPFYPNQPCPAGAQQNVSCGWPPTWGGALAQSVYQRVPRVYCRTCHVALADFFNPNSFSDWTNKKSLIGSVINSQHFMPFAEVPYDAFWLDFQAQTALQAFLQANGP